jgi:putative methionine-R-sulfoxide reductase with GAF domain
MGGTESRKGSGANGFPSRAQTVPQEKTKPVLDEQTFSKLLEAAYVVQEHNREVRALDLPIDLKQKQYDAENRENPAPQIDPQSQFSDAAANTAAELPLAKIVETQHDIQLRHLKLENALQLVADRVVEIARASGAAIGFAEGNSVLYRAVSGRGTPIEGSAVPLNKCLCAPCLKSGQAFRCSDVAKESSFDSRDCKNRGILALIAVPIFHDGRVAGGLEIHFPSPRTLTEQDVHTCQLMAGLVSEALARDEEITRKQSLATERAAMLEALEKLQPNLAALIEQPAVKVTPASSTPETMPRSYSCRRCGHQLKPEEQFCGQCGTARSSDYQAPNMQSKVASLWQMQESRKKDPSADDAQDLLASKGSEKTEGSAEPTTLDQPIEAELSEPLADSGDSQEPVGLAAATVPPNEIVSEEEDLPADQAEVSGEELKRSEALTLAKAAHPAHWASARSARAFLEKLEPAKHRGTLLRLWDKHRGDIYLAIAVILVLCVIGWGVRTDHAAKTRKPAAANATNRKPSPESDLSFFDRVLVQLGLAEPPPTPEDKGNPTAQVWVDLHTALYYCRGTDLYGKTPQGKFTTQRAAQLDQFEPAYRKACK